MIDQQSSRASLLRLPTEMEAPPDDAESAVVLPEKDLENVGAEIADSGPFPIPEVSSARLLLSSPSPPSLSSHFKFRSQNLEKFIGFSKGVTMPKFPTARSQLHRCLG